MSTVQIEGLNVVVLCASDLKRSIEFYTGTLGMKMGKNFGSGQLLQAGDDKTGVTIHLEGGHEAQKPDLKKAQVSVCFRTSSIKASYEALKAAKVPMLMEYRELRQDFAMFMIADPDGLAIEFAGKP
jgi:catechol 2,3-dioxygenase-like lactoylglutathione lyase family enzyme